MTEEELYRTYSEWTGALHHWVQICLGRHVDCQYFPEQWVFLIYSGEAQEPQLHSWGFQTVPNLSRPPNENVAEIHLPRPADNPTREQLNHVFRGICLAAARVLEIPLEKTKMIEESMIFLNDPPRPSD